MTVDSDSYLARVKERLASVADPVERARVANEEIGATTDALRTLGAFRAQAIRDARRNMSAQSIAEAMGVTRARVYQLLDE